MLTFRKRILAILAGLLTLSIAAPALAYHENGDHPFGNDRFEDRRDRTERPVIQGDVDRTWIWGPKPYTEAMTEPYEEAPGGERMVQYFDKSRMEINDPDAQGLWSVTNGLLVSEMIDGKYQIGDDEFDHSPEPADIPIAGDSLGSNSPTYADISAFGLRDRDPLAEGTVINEHVTESGVAQSAEYSDYGVTADVHVSETNHTVALPFWNFMNSAGTVYDNGNLVRDYLFENPFYATGYPITEAYWTTTPVDGESTDVLWQCFERRCLTFTPENDEGWQVETGNVGQHYYKWRHGDEEGDETRNAQIYLVDIDEEGDELGGALEPVDVQIPEHGTVEDQIAATVDELLGYEHDELDNAYAEANASVESVKITDGLATVNLTGEVPIGGIGDHPRIENQLHETVTQFEGVDDVVGLLDGGPIIEPLATPDGGVEAVFDVSGEQFRVWVTNEDTIDDLYALQDGESNANIPNGPIENGPGEGGLNNPWDWHLDPEETEMAEATTEVCDGSPSFVEANKDYFVDDVGRYCAWNAELVELNDYR